ncbi:mRNA-decapping enzyme 1A [Venturia canescens]|uniref:mRNA-decapping enzyme 1A n=1 Tax=Venturia canescens TaxID=32260 RepID=UPI001C9D4037|nr:mRNA-decapping enzyme 1A [Venturia canescens]XP_043271341.1 mRNA-decapping enzyme 1A [Venturia canescens]XP_043271342.1 mRNA-decapping enzyme 1A [Venturia canescens]
MTDLTELRMNVAALKRVDPYIKDILETATHVALYTFNADNNEWEKTDIEGALFVYSRNGEPYNSILIMNRLNTNNLVEPVTLGLDLQLQEPFLLYRNSKSDIYGIWFYDKVECIRIAAMLNTLVKDSELNRKVSVNTVQKNNKVSKPNTNNVDIFSMLSKAQEVFNTNKSGEVTSGIGSKSPINHNARDICCPLSAPLGPDVTSQSVMDFFARAKVNTGHFKAGDHPNAHNVGVAESKPMLARLMSHPAAHTLEHIEKQQRSTTPQPGLSSHVPAQPQSSTISQVNNVVSGSSSARAKRHNKSNVTQDDSVVSALTSVSQELQRQVSRNTSDTNGASSFLRIDSPSVKTANSTNHQSNNIVSSCKTDPILSLFETESTTLESEDIKASGTLKSMVTGPALIPPVMFGAPSPSEPLSRPLEPLTRNQLLQAFNYLLRSDPDFVNKLHEAYVKSFGEILS